MIYASEFQTLAQIAIGLAGFTDSERAAWRLAQGLFGLYHAVIMAGFFLAADLSQVTRLEWSVVPPALVVLCAQLATAAGFWPVATESVYFAAPIWFLFIASLAFFLLPLESGTAGAEDARAERPDQG